MRRLLVLLVLALPFGSGGAQGLLPPIAEAHHDRAMEAAARGDREAARAAWRALIDAAPAVGLAHSWWAMEMAGTAIREGDYSPETWGPVLAHSRLASDLLPAQLAAHVQGGTLRPVDADVALLLAHGLHAFAAARLRRAEEAQQHLDAARAHRNAARAADAASVNPGNEALLVRAEELIASCEEAVHSSRAMVLSPLETLVGSGGADVRERAAPLYVHGADGLRRCGYFTEAALYYERALALAPHHPDASDGLRRARAGDNQ